MGKRLTACLLLVLAGFMAAPGTTLAQDFSEEVWAFDAGGTESGDSIAVDGDGNVYVLSSINDGTGANSALIAYNPQGLIQWMEFYGAGDGRTAKAVAASPMGEVYVTGDYDNGESLDCLIVAYTSSGTERWTQAYDRYGSDDMCNDIAVDRAGDVVAAGQSNALVGSNYVSLFVKYDPAGTRLASATDVVALPARNYVQRIAVDGDNNIYSITKNGYTHYYITKHDSNLVKQRFNASFHNGIRLVPTAITADDSGSIYVAGWVNQTDPADGIAKFYHKFIRMDIYGGTWCGAKRLFNYGGTYADWYDGYYGATVDEDGFIYLTGSDNKNYLTIKYNSSCQAVWPADPDDHLVWDGDPFDKAKAIAVDGDGNIYITGASGVSNEGPTNTVTVKYSN